MLENTDIIVAAAGLALIVLITVFVFARNIILQAKKNAMVRSMRVEHKRAEAVRKANLTNMWTMLEKY